MVNDKNFDRVEKPVHYNSHPNNIECWDVIEYHGAAIANAIKYLWRLGLKKEIGMSELEKTIEDVNKSKWYIRKRILQSGKENIRTETHPSGYDREKILEGFNTQYIRPVIAELLYDNPKGRADKNSLNLCLTILNDYTKELESQKLLKK